LLTSEFADHAFTGADVANDATTCDPLEDILAVPGYQMSVVDDVLFAFSELLLC
jgi:hypothetical protein